MFTLDLWYFFYHVGDMSASFGELLKNSRIEKGITLRQCSDALGFDPSNWSKMERGINPAPKDTAVLEKWADFLGVFGEGRQTFLDMAALSRKELPADIASDQTVLAALPVFFRARRGAEMDDEKLAKFVEQVRRLHSPDATA